MEPENFLKLLWKKESTKPNALLIDIFDVAGIGHDESDENFGMFGSELWANFGVQTLRKFDASATAHRMNGNEKFQKGDLYGAMNLYGKSTMYAEVGSECLSLAYANRSTCFFHLGMYEKCLTDIELATKAGYPERLMPKLEKRRADCLKQMENNEPTEKFVPKLDFPADKNFPELANVLQIEYNEKFGRHVIAKCDIEAGKVVLLDKSYAHQMRSFEFRHCGTCLKTSTNFIPCDKCYGVLYCDEECMEKHPWHKTECDELALNQDAYKQYLARTIFNGIRAVPNVEDLMAFVEKAVNEDMSNLPPSLNDNMTKYQAFLNRKVFLPSLPDKRFHLLLAYVCYKNLLKHQLIKNMFDTKSKQRFLMHLTIYHYAVLTCTSVKFEHNDCIFLTQSFFKHSCVPNLLMHQYGNLLLGTTARPIKKGQQLFLRYTGDFIEDKKARQALILKNFNIKCECEMCEPDQWPKNTVNMVDDPINLFIQANSSSLRGYDKQKHQLVRLALIKLLNKYGVYGWSMELQKIVADFDMLLQFYYNRLV